VLDSVGVPVIPRDRNSAPSRSDNCALIGRRGTPANAVVNFEKSRLCAGHYSWALFMMLTQISVKRLHAGICQQRFEHHVAAAAHCEMFAVGFAQCFDSSVAVLLINTASRITMPTVQTLLCHFASPHGDTMVHLIWRPAGIASSTAKARRMTRQELIQYCMLQCELGSRGRGGISGRRAPAIWTRSHLY
jgi:hypothetical protein